MLLEQLQSFLDFCFINKFRASVQPPYDSLMSGTGAWRKQNWQRRVVCRLQAGGEVNPCFLGHLAVWVSEVDPGICDNLFGS